MNYLEDLEAKVEAAQSAEELHALLQELEQLEAGWRRAVAAAAARLGIPDPIHKIANADVTGLAESVERLRARDTSKAEN